MSPRAVTASLSDILMEAASDLEASVGIEHFDDSPLWVPLEPQAGRGIVMPDGSVVSPQRAAFESFADELFYGGAPGGGKSQLLLGLAVTRHRNTAIFRREFTQFRGQDGLWEKSRELIGLRGKSNDGHYTWRNLPGGRAIEMLGCDRWEDVLKYKGRGHDLKGFDELPEFEERAYRFLIGWLRTSHPGQRTRVVGAGNPPVNEEGQWVIRYWGPWLDPHHAKPAKPGELRWFVTDGNGKDLEVPGPTSGPGRAPDVLIETKDGPTWISPRSRTYIGARVEDNPYYMSTGYAQVLANLPEPLRSQMRHGNFQAGRQDHEWQVIPTEWVVAAQARWRPEGGNGLPLSSVGNDPSRGGQDEFVVARRHDNWVAPLDVHPATAAPDGQRGAAIVYRSIGGARGVPVQIDIIGSAGSSVYDQCRDLKIKAVAMNGSKRSKARDKSGTLGFVNLRAEWHWKMRELLDPESEQEMALPPDPQLKSDLCSPRWRPTPRGIQVEEKEEIKKRLGRSPDRGEAVIYACVRADSSAPFELLFSGAEPDEVEDEVRELERRLGLPGGM